MRTHWFLLSLLLLLAGPLSAQDKPKKDPPRKEPAKKDGGKKTDKAQPAEATVKGAVGGYLDAYVLNKRFFPNGFCGVVLVAKGGEVLLEKGYGMMDEDKKLPMRADSQWDWCSVTKQFTAAGVLRLAMQKKLALDDPLSKHLKNVPSDKAKITIRHLLNHTSGLEQGGDWSKVDPHQRDSVVRKILSMKMDSEPGAKWAYSNAAYFLLAALIERISGKSYEEFMHEQVFKPAGLVDTGLIGEKIVDLDRVPHQDRGKGEQFAYGNRMSWGYRGAGGVVATVRDMLRWDQALRGDKVLDAAMKKEYYEPALSNYALGWEVTKEGKHLRAEHSGHTGELVTYYLRFLDEELVVAIGSAGEPALHPKILASNLAVIARTGQPPPGMDR